MTTEARRLLLVLTGPVGGGKSTVALRLAERLRALSAGGAVSRVAVVDLDLVADMVRPHVHYGEDDLWRLARHICGGLADAIYREGHDAVIVEGEFFPAAELAALVGSLTTRVEVRLFTLDVSYEACLARVAADPSPGRNLSRDPGFLRIMSAQFQSELPWLRLAGTVVDANAATAEELADIICARLSLDTSPAIDP